MPKKSPIVYAVDSKKVFLLFRLRLPALLVGLVLGLGISFLTSRFEDVLAHDIRTAFFLPFIVYLADAIGTQTEAIYVRDLKSGRARFHEYLAKESLLGLIFGLIFGAASAVVAWYWLADQPLALSVGLATMISATLAPPTALIISQTIFHFHQDPAAESGPIATVVQDMISVVVYGIVCSIILL